MSMGIAVLGMHRSGTSCLTGLLEDAGVWLGDVSKKNPFNRKGNQERLSIMKLHDDVMATNGGSWDNPPTPPVTWSEQQLDELRELIAEYNTHDLWAFKDPRSLFTIEKWRDLVPDLRFIGTLRHPLAVAQSLHNRSRMPYEAGVELWRRYNERLLQVHRREHFPIVNFNLSPEQYLERVKRAFAHIGLQVDKGGLSFFDEGLRSSAPDVDFELPAAAASLYDELLTVAGSDA